MSTPTNADERAMRHAIRNAKRTLASAAPSFATLDDALGAELSGLAEDAVPSVDFGALRGASALPESVAAAVRRRGVLIVRGVFDADAAARLDAALEAYLAASRSAAFDPDARQILALYWSPAQVEARQSPRLAHAVRCLQALWRDGGAFDRRRAFTYVDRVRRRAPGDTTLALGPHVDTGSIERWLDAGFGRVYREVFAGRWAAHDPFDGRHRPRVDTLRGSSVCSMFRTFQGWVALSAQGPGDGTLQLVPSLLAMPWLLLRALQADVADDDLCGAVAGTALKLHARWHARVLDGLISLPRVEPGDTVWWHPDVVHGVEPRHAGRRPAKVLYVPAAPVCARNLAYARRQADAFARGESPPDFPPEHLEVGFEGRATAADLSPLGAAQMGLAG